MFQVTMVLFVLNQCLNIRLMLDNNRISDLYSKSSGDDCRHFAYKMIKNNSFLHFFYRFL